MLALLCTLLLAANVNGHSSSSSSSTSSSSTCIATVSSAPVPHKVQAEIGRLQATAPSVLSIGMILSTVELESTTLQHAEYEVEYYEQSYQSQVKELESMYEYPSLYTSAGEITAMAVAYSSLASAVSCIFALEQTQSALAHFQPTLQALELSYSTVLTDLSMFTDYAYPSLFSASEKITQATLTDSSIFASVLAVSTAVSGSPTVSSAVSYLSKAMYTVPATVVAQVISMISSPSTVSSSVVSRLQSCYSTLYSQVSEVAAFAYSYPSVVTDLTDYLSAAARVTGLGEAVSLVVYDQMPTLTYQLSVLSQAMSTLPQLTDDLNVLTIVTGQSPRLAEAESTLEASFYASPSVAYSIYFALDYPALVHDPSNVQDFEESHQSLVYAIELINSWETYYAPSASILSGVENQLTSAFQHYRTLLTAYSYLVDITSPTIASAGSAISAAKSVVSDVTHVLSRLSHIVSSKPSLSCAESVLEYYAQHYPSVATHVWSVQVGQSTVPHSQLYSWQSLTASYSSLLSAVDTILSEAVYYSSLDSLQSSLILAASSDASLLTQYEAIGSESDWAFDEWQSAYVSAASSYQTSTC